MLCGNKLCASFAHAAKDVQLAFPLIIRSNAMSFFHSAAACNTYAGHTKASAHASMELHMMLCIIALLQLLKQCLFYICKP